MNAVLRAASLGDAPFWAWWLAPVGVTAVAALALAVAHRERRPDRREHDLADYDAFRRAMSRIRERGGHR